MTNNYNKLVKKIKERIPDFEVKYKDESTFMKVLSKILFFNKNFMTSYTTTIGKTVYFPSRKKVKEHPDTYFDILAHEYVHVLDYCDRPVIFPIIYLLPQLLAILSLGAFFTPWMLLFLFFLLPIPSYGRAWVELRGYGMNCKIMDWRGQMKDGYIDRVADYFVGPSYYFMWPFRKCIIKKLHKFDDTLLKNPAYKDVHDILNV